MTAKEICAKINQRFPEYNWVIDTNYISGQLILRRCAKNTHWDDMYVCDVTNLKDTLGNVKRILKT